MVPTPNTNDLQGATSGGHCLLCVGYSDPDQVLVVRNTWGADWGDKGYCYIPYGYVMNEELNNGDAWIIKRIDPIEPNESSWSQGDDSILEALDGYRHDLSEGEHNDLVGSMGEVPLEVRLALLFLKAACGDAHLDAIEVDSIASYLQLVLDQLGSTVSTKALIHNSKQNLVNHGLVDSSIKLLSEQLSNVVLAGIHNQIIALASVDDNEANQEDRWIKRLASSWQLEISEIDVTNEGSGTEVEAAES